MKASEPAHVIVIASSRARAEAVRVRAHGAVASVVGPVERSPSQLATDYGLHEADVIVVADRAALRWLEAAAQRGAAGTAPVLVVGDEDEREGVTAALASRLGGALSAAVPEPQLRAAIEAVRSGLRVAVRVAGNQGAAPSASDGEDAIDVEPLTARERDVLQLLALGLRNRAVAERLGISPHTVKFHVAAILAKLGVATRTEAVRQGLRRGLLTM